MLPAGIKLARYHGKADALLLAAGLEHDPVSFFRREQTVRAEEKLHQGADVIYGQGRA